MIVRNKANSVDFKWFIVRTRTNQERKLRDILLLHKGEIKNILDVYCPTHTTVRAVREGHSVDAPLFAGHVFVLATQASLVEALSQHYPEGSILCKRKSERSKVLSYRTVPEEQMRFFKDFNENFAEHIVVLERPFSYYSFNPKNNEANEVVKVLDGPLAGQIGYLIRMNRDRNLVFSMRGFDGQTSMTVAVPNVWNFNVVRLHNADADRQSQATVKERAVDLLIGKIQGCGYVENAFAVLQSIVGKLVVKPSLISLCKDLFKCGYCELSQAIAKLSPKEAEQVLYLARYAKECPDYMENWLQTAMRPFLTPTSGIAELDGKGYAELKHSSFIEVICEVSFTEHTYHPKTDEEQQERVAYYAHIGIKRIGAGSYAVFANWDKFLGEYFLTARGARRKLLSGYSIENDIKKMSADEAKRIDSFTKYAPTLYHVLLDEKRVKAVTELPLGDVEADAQTATSSLKKNLNKSSKMNVLAIMLNGVSLSEDTPLMENEQIRSAADELISTGIQICKEISTTTHLAIWRRYLRTVWLHQ